MKKLQYFLEKQVFGVCSTLGEVMGISSSVIRLYFIYTTFLTFGSPIILYLILAFWINVKHYIRKGTTVEEFL